MIAVDTNIHVHAHRADSAFHRPALQRLTALAEGSEARAIRQLWSADRDFGRFAGVPIVNPLFQA